MSHVGTSLNYAQNMCIVYQFKSDLADHFTFSIKRKSSKKNLRACNACFAFTEYTSLKKRDICVIKKYTDSV